MLEYLTSRWCSRLVKVAKCFDKEIDQKQEATLDRVRTNLEWPWKCLDLKKKIQGLESRWMFWRSAWNSLNLMNEIFVQHLTRFMTFFDGKNSSAFGYHNQVTVLHQDSWTKNVLFDQMIVLELNKLNVFVLFTRSISSSGF